MPFLLDYPTNTSISFVRQNFVNWTYGGGLPSTQSTQGSPCAIATTFSIDRTLLGIIRRETTCMSSPSKKQYGAAIAVMDGNAGQGRIGFR